MSRRNGVQITVRQQADGGESPNRFVPLVSAHVRLYWPPLASREEVLAALTKAYLDTCVEVDLKFKEEDE